MWFSKKVNLFCIFIFFFCFSLDAMQDDSTEVFRECVGHMSRSVSDNSLDQPRLSDELAKLFLETHIQEEVYNFKDCDFKRIYLNKWYYINYGVLLIDFKLNKKNDPLFLSDFIKIFREDLLKRRLGELKGSIPVSFPVDLKLVHPEEILELVRLIIRYYDSPDDHRVGGNVSYVSCFDGYQKKCFYFDPIDGVCWENFDPIRQSCSFARGVDSSKFIIRFLGYAFY